ncbi:transmembrane amino acid transporter protein-domain-containing protein [Tuber indicum]|nr:transmembrane amino acid transporter protein-domain-containing protein [Tuber indicum]
MSSANYESITQEDRDEATSSPEGRRHRRHGRIAHPAGEASWGSSVVNLLNTIVGAGVLAMPHAMSQFGITLGVFVILFSGFMSGFGLYLQTRCAKYIDRGTASFFTLSQLTFPNAAVVFDFAIAIKCFGVAISYLIIIGDLMPQVILGFNQNAGDIDYLIDRHFWITGYMLVIIPLSFLRRLDSLKYTSFVALISIGYLIIIVLAHFLKGDTLGDRGDVRLITWAGPIEALSSFPVIVFAYTCHQNMFSILNEIKDASHKSTLNVVLGSIGSASSIYVLVAITGYLSYGDNIGGNIIAMYPSSWTSTIGRVAIVILVMFSYPLQAHPCRASIDNILKWKPFQRRVGSRPPSPGRAHEMSDWRFALITTAIIVGTYLVAMTVNSLERVLAYVGSTGSTSISFILPGLFYWKISNPESDNHRLLKEDEDSDEEEGDHRADTWKSRLLRRGAMGLAIYGFVVMITCLTLNTFYVVAH